VVFFRQAGPTKLFGGPSLFLKFALAAHSKLNISVQHPQGSQFPTASGKRLEQCLLKIDFISELIVQFAQLRS
jgi:hypothetical protein